MPTELIKEGEVMAALAEDSQTRPRLGATKGRFCKKRITTTEQPGRHPKAPTGGTSERHQHRRGLSPRSRYGGPLQLELGLLLLLGFPELLIDRTDPRQEALHRRKELILQPGDLFFPIGVIDPAAPQGLPPVALQKPQQRPLAGLHQGNRITLRGAAT